MNNNLDPTHENNLLQMATESTGFFFKGFSFYKDKFVITVWKLLNEK